MLYSSASVFTFLHVRVHIVLSGVLSTEMYIGSCYVLSTSCIYKFIIAFLVTFHILAPNPPAEESFQPPFVRLAPPLHESENEVWLRSYTFVFDQKFLSLKLLLIFTTFFFN